MEDLTKNPGLRHVAEEIFLNLKIVQLDKCRKKLMNHGKISSTFLRFVFANRLLIKIQLQEVRYFQQITYDFVFGGQPSLHISMSFFLVRQLFLHHLPYAFSFLRSHF